VNEGRFEGAFLSGKAAAENLLKQTDDPQS